MPLDLGSEIQLASPDLRDKFLVALDERDEAALRHVADYLFGCQNPLPFSTCALLGLKPGSTYGDGAKAVATRQSAEEREG
jgi:hypothetical protein